LWSSCSVFLVYIDGRVVVCAGVACLVDCFVAGRFLVLYFNVWLRLLFLRWFLLDRMWFPWTCVRLFQF